MSAWRDRSDQGFVNGLKKLRLLRKTGFLIQFMWFELKGRCSEHGWMLLWQLPNLLLTQASLPLAKGRSWSKAGPAPHHLETLERQQHCLCIPWQEIPLCEKICHSPTMAWAGEKKDINRWSTEWCFSCINCFILSHSSKTNGERDQLLNVQTWLELAFWVYFRNEL